MEPQYSPQSRAERLIAAGRVVLSVASLFAVWFDPTEPTKSASIAYSLLVFYVFYSLAVALVVWRADAPSPGQQLFTHAFDFAFFSLFIYFTAGPASPFLVYFVFSLVCATLRWQRRGVFWTAAAALGTFAALTVLFGEVLADPAFDRSALVIRGVYLSVIAVLLGYLGAHEEQARRDMALLASWPEGLPKQLEALTEELLRHASRVMEAPRALLTWADREEPWVYLAALEEGAFLWQRSSPEAFGSGVAEALAGTSFLCADAGANGADPPAVLRRTGKGLERWRGAPLDPRLRQRFGLRAVLGLPLASDAGDGWLLFADKPGMTSDDLLLGEIAAAVVASRLEHFHLSRRVQETVAMEERIRLARDLHDGVLQSLTGIGLRLAVARAQIDEAPAAARAALESLQRLIALEQRDLRFFIRDLKPTLVAPAGEPPHLADRLAELVQRTELEWGLRAELRTDGLPEAIPEPLAREVYLVVREALVNAVRHGEASAVRVEVAREAADGAGLAVSVVDNGRGFPFHGRFGQDELVAEDRGPRTLLSRVAALKGTLTLESSLSGARLDIVLPSTGGP